MAVQQATGYAFNRTRNVYLATQMRVADTHWARFRGLMCTKPEQFRPGHGLWIVPCRGVHTLVMNYPIDLVYLDKHQMVVHLARNVRPWRIAALRMNAASVLELPASSLDSTGSAIGDEIEIAMGMREAIRV